MGEILRAENISKTYQAGRVVVKALNRCSFSVERGECVERFMWKVKKFRG